jgi:hypothetical protein
MKSLHVIASSQKAMLPARARDRVVFVVEMASELLHAIL